MAEDRMLSDEVLLALIKKNSGGGGGGTDDYNDLKNQPQINGNTLVGNKSASDLGLVAAETGKGLSTNDYTDADKAIVGGVTAALAGKQNALTAGSHIAIDDDTISVNRWAVPAGKVVYTVITSDENYGQNVHVQRHTLGGALIDDRTFLCVSYTTVNVDDLISIFNPYSSFNITLLADSDEHQSGYGYTVNPITTPTSNSFTFTLPQEENDNDLIVRSELNAVSSAVSAIKDGTNIDSFAEVETALAGKADLTDLAPAFSTSTAYTVGQYVSYDGNIYKCTSAHSKGSWAAGDFTLVAVGSELESKQDKTDNNLNTADKTTTGAINELKSGLTNLDVALDVPDGTGKNLIPMTIEKIKALNTAGTWSGNVYTVNGVTFAINTDNDGKVTGITINGTASAVSGIYIDAGNIAGRYIINGCPTGGASDTYRLDARNLDNDSVMGTDMGDGATFNTVSTINISAYIRIASGYVATNLIFHPMIRPATITDPTFAPYIPSVESRIEAVESGLMTAQSDLTNLTSFASLTHLSDTKNLDTDFPLLGLYQGDRLTGTTPYALTGGTGILVLSATSGNIKQQVLFDPQNNKISMRTTKYSSSGWYWAAWSTVSLTPVT